MLRSRPPPSCSKHASSTSSPTSACGFEHVKTSQHNTPNEYMSLRRVCWIPYIEKIHQCVRLSEVYFIDYLCIELNVVEYLAGSQTK